MGSQMSWREFGQQWIVGGLVVIMGSLDPMMVLAQGQKGAIRPPIVGKHEGPQDAVLDAIASDILATTQDAHQYSPSASHTRRQATNLRSLAKYAQDKDLDVQIIAWANAQDPDVFQFQQPDQKTIDKAIAARRAQGLPIDDITQGLNMAPEQKRTILIFLRTKGLSGALLNTASGLEKMVPSSDPRVSPITDKADAGGGGAYNMAPPNCATLLLIGAGLNATGFILALFLGIIGLIVGLIVVTVALFLNWWSLAGCPGAPKLGSLPVSFRTPLLQAA